MLETLSAAWDLSFWIASVVFFVGLMLSVATGLFAILCAIVAPIFDRIAARHIDNEEGRR